MIEKVISGGQSGSDQAGWRAAKRAGKATGGAMPRGFRTEYGNRPDFKILYGAFELDSTDWGPRTQRNVDDSDMTLYVRRNNRDSPGFWKTKTCAEKSIKPFWDITEAKFSLDPLQVARFLRLFNYKTINVAGTRESRDPGIGAWAEEFVYTVLTNL